MLAEAALLVALSVQQGRGAEACLGEDALRRGVERRLKRRVFADPAQARLKLVVSFIRSGAAIEARIELSSIDGTPRGTRSLLTSGHCSALDDSLALSVALLVDQPPEPEASAMIDASLPPPAPAAGGSSSPVAPPAPRRAPSPTPLEIPPEVAAPREPWRVQVGASAVGAWGVLPAIRPALALHLRLVPRRFPAILLEGEGFWPATAERDASSGARFRLFRAGLALCPALLEGSPLSLSLCAGQQVAWLTVEGYGFDHDRRDRRLGFSLTAGGESRLRLFAPVSVRAYLGAEVPLTRDRFVASGRRATQLFEPAPIALLGEIGLEVALWQ